MEVCYLWQHGWSGYLSTSEMSQAEKDKYCMLWLLCGIQKIKQINDIKTKNDTGNRLVATSGDGEGGQNRND